MWFSHMFSGYKTFKHIKKFITLKGKLEYPVVSHEISWSKCPGVRQFNSLHMVLKKQCIPWGIELESLANMVFYVITLGRLIWLRIQFRKITFKNNNVN